MTLDVYIRARMRNEAAAEQMAREYRSKFNNEELSNYVVEKFGNNVEWMEVKSIEFSPSCKPEEVSE